MPGAELDDQVDPDRRPGEGARGGPAERDRRVEHATGDAADREGTGRDGEPDRQPEEPVARLVLAGGYVEHHVAQGEGDEQFHHGGGRLRDRSVQVVTSRGRRAAPSRSSRPANTQQSSSNADTEQHNGR